MGEQTLFPLPVRVRFCDPSDLGTADAGQICRCDDGLDYMVKDDKCGVGGALTPHAEWFCTRLAELVGIASPQAKIVQMDDGARWFGSRWEGGTLAGGRWWERVGSGEIPLSDISGTLSRIYVFDQFISNPDRHVSNFLVRDQYNGVAVLAFDYSRAWICDGFPPDPEPLHPTTKTVVVQRYLRNLWGENYIIAAEAKDMASRLGQVPVSAIQTIIEDHPKEWLPSEIKAAILEWWSSPLLKERSEAIAKGVEDGSYL